MGGRKIATQKSPVILLNRGAERVLSCLGDAMYAGNIQQKRSFLADKKGKQIGSKLLTVIDDPFIPGDWVQGIMTVTDFLPGSEPFLLKES